MPDLVKQQPTENRWKADAQAGAASLALTGNTFGAGAAEFFQLLFVDETFPPHHKNHPIGFLQPGVGTPQEVDHGNQEHFGDDQGNNE
jgi:hypothetical protein